MAERGNRLLRAADALVGPVLLRLLSAAISRKPIPQQPRAIGVLCFGAIGDMLLLSSVVEGLRMKLPATRIVLIGSGTNRAVAPLLDIAEFVSLPVSRPDKALLALRKMKLDLILDSTQWARLPAILCALSGAATIGFQTAGQTRHYCYGTRVPHRNDIHEVDNFRALAALVVGQLSNRPRLVVKDADRAHIQALNLGRYVVFHAWPSGINSELKQWPAANWVALAQWVGAAEATVAITGAGVDAEPSAALAEAIGAHARVANLAGKLSLAQTAALLEQSSCTISVNTGIMHMAATFDRPLIALHGPTNPLRWGPLSDHATNCVSPLPGCGYLNLGFEYPPDPPDCMGAISPAMLKHALEMALA